jgi:hypothetical protein
MKGSYRSRITAATAFAAVLLAPAGCVKAGPSDDGVVTGHSLGRNDKNCVLLLTSNSTHKTTQVTLAAGDDGNIICTVAQKGDSTYSRQPKETANGTVKTVSVTAHYQLRWQPPGFNSGDPCYLSRLYAGSHVLLPDPDKKNDLRCDAAKSDPTKVYDDGPYSADIIAEENA